MSPKGSVPEERSRRDVDVDVDGETSTYTVTDVYCQFGFPDYCSADCVEAVYLAGVAQAIAGVGAGCGSTPHDVCRKL